MHACALQWIMYNSRICVADVLVFVVKNDLTFTIQSDQIYCRVHWRSVIVIDKSPREMRRVFSKHNFVILGDNISTDIWILKMRSWSSHKERDSNKSPLQSPISHGYTCWICLKYLHAPRQLHCQKTTPLLWRHNGRDSVSNHQPHQCLLNGLFSRSSKKTFKLVVTGLCAGNSPGTCEFPTRMASEAENVSIWWRHHANI